MSSLAGHLVRIIKRHQNLLIIISLVLVALPFVALSFYNHPSLDDILDAVTVQKLGFWAAQKHFYFTHTGRYTTTVLLALINPLIYGRMEGSWGLVAVGFMVGTLLLLRLFLAELPGLSSGGRWLMATILLSRPLLRCAEGSGRTPVAPLARAAGPGIGDAPLLWG